MWNMVDAERTSSAWYFAALLVIGSYFLLNVFIAGISSVFLRLRRENQALVEIRRLRRQNAKAKAWHQTLLGRL